MRGGTGALARVAIDVDNPGHHVFSDAGGDVSMNDHRRFLIHSGTVISRVPFDFYRQRNPEPAGDRVSTTRIQYSPVFLIVLGIQLMQPLIKRSNAGLRQINRLRKHHNVIR